MSNVLEMTLKDRVAYVTPKFKEAAAENDITIEDWALAHQAQHCQQIHDLEQQVKELQAAFVTLIQQLSGRATQSDPKEEIYN